MATFGENLRRVRRKRGLLQEELGKRLRCGQNLVHLYEMDKVKPGLGRLVDICRTLNCPPQELVEDFPDQEKGDKE